MLKPNESPAPAQNERTDKFHKWIVDAVDKYFTGTDFHLVMGTLSSATSDRLQSFLTDCGVEDKSSILHACGEVWHITHCMAFLAELYHWNALREQSKTEQP